MKGFIETLLAFILGETVVMGGFLFLFTRKKVMKKYVKFTQDVAEEIMDEDE